MQNGRLGMVREVQKKLYGGRYAATSLDGEPDFVRLAAAYGIGAALADSNDSAERIAHGMLSAKEPFLLVCRVDPDTPTI